MSTGPTMEGPMLRSRPILLLLLCCLPACVTPPEVKQALAAKEQAYNDNVALMQQYETLVRNINERTLYWSRFLKTREYLDLVLKLATAEKLDPGKSDIYRRTIRGGLTLSEREAEFLQKQKSGESIKEVEKLTPAETTRLQLGDKMMDRLQAVRLDPGKPDHDMNNLLRALPGLVTLAEDMAAADASIITGQIDYSAFDDYRTNVTALRRINAMIKRYLDIDVTIKDEDALQLADALHRLR
jgi:hypothetical protein